MKNKIKSIAALAATLLLVACGVLTPAQKVSLQADALNLAKTAAKSALIDFAESEVAQVIGGKSVSVADVGHIAAAAVWSVATSSATANAVEKAINDATSGAAAPIASAAATAFDNAAPKTPGDKAAVANAIASGISAAAVAASAAGQ